jgi:hypothetical protein
MATTIADIPERDGDDGARQLLLLRSYLKDKDGEKYPDTVLVPALVLKDGVSLWRSLHGYPVTAIPWSYDPLAFSDPISRLRLEIGDTIEEDLGYTDYELNLFMTVMPLRYVASTILMLGSEEKTTPFDKNNPITILRGGFDGQGVLPDVSLYTDGALAKLLITSRQNPFELLTSVFDNNVRGTILSRSNSDTGGSGFASLDGISFSKDGQAELLSSEQRSLDRGGLLEQMLNSVYYRDGLFETWVEGVSIPDIDDGGWYEI